MPIMCNYLIRERVKIVCKDKTDMMPQEENVNVMEDRLEKFNEVLMACTDASVKDGHIVGHIEIRTVENKCETSRTMHTSNWNMN